MVGLVEAEQDLGAGRDVAQLRDARSGWANAARAVLAPLRVCNLMYGSAQALCCAARSDGGPKAQWCCLHLAHQRRTTMDTNSKPWASPAAMASAPGSMPHEYHQSAPLSLVRS